MTDKSIEMPRRPAKYVNINTRLEKHGDSEVLCADISVRGFHIERDEFNFVMGDKHAWNAFFNEAKGKPAEPLWRNVKDIQLTDEFEGCDVSFGLGLTDNSIDFDDARIAKITLRRVSGGTTEMDCLVQTEIEDTDDVASLLEFLNSEGTLAMTLGGKAAPNGKKRQQKLDLSVPAKDKGDGKSEDGEQPAVH